MRCSHGARLAAVLHRSSDTIEHDWPDGREAACCCRPAVLCLLCDAAAIRRSVTLCGPVEMVDALRARDNEQRPKLLN
jgi:hypothetical protein